MAELASDAVCPRPRSSQLHHAMGTAGAGRGTADWPRNHAGHKEIRPGNPGGVDLQALIVHARKDASQKIGSRASHKHDLGSWAASWAERMRGRLAAGAASSPASSPASKPPSSSKDSRPAWRPCLRFSALTAASCAVLHPNNNHPSAIQVQHGAVQGDIMPCLSTNLQGMTRLTTCHCCRLTCMQSLQSSSFMALRARRHGPCR